MTETMPQGHAVLRTVAMPADVNGAGDIFGGWVLSQMDIAGGIVSAERARGRVATVAIEAMKFIRPVKVSDILCIYGEVERVGNTSVAVRLDAWVVRGQGATTEKVTEGVFTFVALDFEGNKRPIDNT
ncbi:acyl-CoA thioesterase [Maritimibacter sp. UBA3975]|uniref:acyl-CoA thioesterase n=1 Tax=Maritimibacter sp. UBA3975 TaxID=1946833 RepID=UPI000C092DF0|nr:acyl-CoA thioesterase [Maritimibacter sp. UBA3975]MAM61601.1 acyl-CoA thioesterase [Maritimibacter sp.]|tara:strand:- start:26725 stop:27108 length:384 start_codon:yes stop_codon:yes gene_type:complete